MTNCVYGKYLSGFTKKEIGKKSITLSTISNFNKKSESYIIYKMYHLNGRNFSQDWWVRIKSMSQILVNSLSLSFSGKALECFMI